MEKQHLDLLTEKVNNGTTTNEELGLYNAWMNGLTLSDTDWVNTESKKKWGVKAELWALIKPQPEKHNLQL